MFDTTSPHFEVPPVADTKIHAELTALTQPLAPEHPPPWQKVTLTDLSAVEELLDRLENEGCDRRLVIVEDLFVVRWREPTAHSC